MEAPDIPAYAARLNRWAASLHPVGSGRLASRLLDLEAAMGSVGEVLRSLTDSLSRDESAAALSRLHVWLSDELGPRITEVIQLAEPVEDALHTLRAGGDERETQ